MAFHQNLPLARDTLLLQHGHTTASIYFPQVLDDEPADAWTHQRSGDTYGDWYEDSEPVGSRVPAIGQRGASYQHSGMVGIRDLGSVECRAVLVFGDFRETKSGVWR